MQLSLIPLHDHLQQNIKTKIKTYKPSITTRSRRKSGRKKRQYVELLDSQDEQLPFSETQMSFDIFDDQFENAMENGNDIEMKDIGNENNTNNKEKSKSSSFQLSGLNPSDMGMEQEFDIISSSW